MHSVLQPPRQKVKRTKKVAAAPYVAKQPPKKEVNPLIEKRPRNFGIGEQQWRNFDRVVMYGCIQAVIFSQREI